MELLIYLVGFYDVQGYETWEQADAESTKDSSEDTSSKRPSSSDKGSQEGQALEDAVRKYPQMAVEALGSLIGLVEDNFSSYQARAAKRAISTERADAKRPRRELPPPPPPPPQPSSSLIRRLTQLEELGPSEPSGPSERTRLAWDPYQPEYQGPTLRSLQREQAPKSGDQSPREEKEDKSEGYLGSPTEALSDNDKPVSRRSLASHPKSPYR
jgi:hypothetical protein